MIPTPEMDSSQLAFPETVVVYGVQAWDYRITSTPEPCPPMNVEATVMAAPWQPPLVAGHDATNVWPSQAFIDCPACNVEIPVASATEFGYWQPMPQYAPQPVMLMPVYSTHAMQQAFAHMSAYSVTDSGALQEA